MSATINVALVGIGGYGDHYLAALFDRPADDAVRLVGVVEPAPERARRLPDLRQRQVPIHADLDALYADGPHPDLIMLATPIHLHAPHTCAALARGSHVLCEKPVGATVDDARKMLAAEQAAARFVAIGYQWSFSDAVQALKRDVMAGEFGRPIRLKTLACVPRATTYFRRNNWAGRIRTADGTPVNDSPVNNATAHFLHNMLYVLGPARELSARPASVQAELYRANDIENYDTAALRCLTDDGAELLFFTSHAVPLAIGPVLHYEFERATVYYEAETRSGLVARFHDGTIRHYGDPNADRHLKIWQCVDAVRRGGDGRRVACGVRTAIAHTQCVAAAGASMPQIRPFPSELVALQTWGGQPMRCVPALAAALVQCYDQAILPSEHRGLKWAARGEVVPLAAATTTAPTAPDCETVALVPSPGTPGEG
jgi:predicted dehydrogenase